MSDTTYKPHLKRPPVFDRLAKRKRLVRDVSICMDPSLVDAHDSARDALSDFTLRHQGEDLDQDGMERLEELEARVQSTRESVRDALETITFAAIGRKRFDRLIDEHPPTDEQVREADEHKPKSLPRPAYNSETFAPALIVRSWVGLIDVDYEVDPDGYEEQALDAERQFIELTNSWNNAELVELWVAALEVNTHRRVPDLGN